MKLHESEVHYNEASQAEGENERDGPIISNNNRRRAATRNTTKRWIQLTFNQRLKG